MIYFPKHEESSSHVFRNERVYLVVDAVVVALVDFVEHVVEFEVSEEIRAEESELIPVYVVVTAPFRLTHSLSRIKRPRK